MSDLLIALGILILAGLVLFVLVLLVLVGLACWWAPIGYEDAQGWHPGEKP